MDDPKTKNPYSFNHFYSNNGFYYGLKLHPEFLGFFEKITDFSGKQALDIGCGEGRYAIWLASRGCSVTAIDMSKEGIRKLSMFAADNKLDICAQVADIETYRFPKNTFDIITAATILDHISVNVLRDVAARITNALKPEGILYADVFTTDDPGYRMKRGNSNAVDVSDTAAFISRYFEKNELKQLFRMLSPIVYRESIEPDLSHGRPHKHGWACLIAQKVG